MSLIPLARMWDRVAVARQDSDTSLFMALLYLGEFVTKLTVAELVAALEDDPDRHKYRQLHRLVRADSIGEWNAALDDLLSGPAASRLVAVAKEEAKQLSQKCGSGSWQYLSVLLLHKCLGQVESSLEPLPVKVDARRWFSLFAVLRNLGRISLAICQDDIVLRSYATTLPHSTH
jgi:hypothetical protein